MELSITLHNEILEFLKSLPNIDDTKSRRAFIYSVGLDSELQDLIPFDEPPAQFIPLLTSMLLDYGKLKDGRYAIEAVLEAAKNYIGEDRKEYCETLLEKLRADISHPKQAPKKSSGIKKIPGRRQYYKLLSFMLILASVIGIIAWSSDKIMPILIKDHCRNITWEWEKDVEMLISMTSSFGFDLSHILHLYEQCIQGKGRMNKIESEYWNTLQVQAEENILKSINYFQTRDVGCFDCVSELQQIQEEFNKEQLESYFTIKQLTDTLSGVYYISNESDSSGQATQTDRPRLRPRDEKKSVGEPLVYSEQFVRELSSWMNADIAWFIRQLQYACIPYFKLTEQSLENLRNENIPTDIMEGLKSLVNKEFQGEALFLETVKKELDTLGGQTELMPDVKYKELLLKYATVNPKENYPTAIKQIESHIATQNPQAQLLGNIVIAEIYLHHHLEQLSEEYFHLAVQNITDEIAQYKQSQLDSTSLKLYMILGLIYQRLCNPELAINEFEKVIEVSKKLGCESEYSVAHYYLGILYLDLKQRINQQDIFVNVTSKDSKEQRREMKSIGEILDLLSISDKAMREFQFYLAYTGRQRSDKKAQFAGYIVDRQY